MNYKELPEITEKQRQILNLVYQYRFINRHQIQRFLMHKDPKRINIWLKDLVEKGYLGRIYSRKLLENTKPAIYYLQNNGILFVRFLKGEEYGAENEQLDFKYIRKLYKDKKASQSFISHCTSVCEICLKYTERGRKSKNIEYEFLTKVENWTYMQMWEADFDELKDAIPDAVVYKTTFTKKDCEVAMFFFDYIDSNVPRYAIRYKIKKLISLCLNEDLDKFSFSSKSPFFALILPNNQTLESMKRYIRKQLEEEDVEALTFILTTHEKMMGEIDASMWEVA